MHLNQYESQVASLSGSTIKHVTSSLNSWMNHATVGTGKSRSWLKRKKRKHPCSNLGQKQQVQLTLVLGLSKNKNSNKLNTLSNRLQMHFLTLMPSKKSHATWWQSQRQSSKSWPKRNLIANLKKWKRSNRSCLTWESPQISRHKYQETPLERKISMMLWHTRLNSSWAASLINLEAWLASLIFTACTTEREVLISSHLTIWVLHAPS